MKKLLITLLAVLFVGGFVLAFAGGAQAQQEAIELLYDDRKELAGLLGVENVTQVSITDQVVLSKKVGTDVLDDNVLVYEDGILYAVGVGSANLTVDGITYPVTVSPAPISLFLITGHSVGIGEQGDAAQSVAIEAGQAYSSHRYWTFENVTEEGRDLVIVPSEVTQTTGLGYNAENRLSGIDAFAPGGGGTIGEGSGLAWRWNQLTGEKVWVINAARGGSCLNHWIPDAEGPVPGSSNRFYGYFKYLYNSARDAYQNAQYILKNEIAAGHYTLSHMAMIYHNGANFSAFEDWTYEKLEQYYDLMWTSFKNDLSTDMDGDGQVETLESLGLAPHWFSTGALSMATDKSVTYYLGTNSAYPDVYVALDHTRWYRTEEDLQNFPDILYTTQSKPVVKPESLLSTKNGGTSDNSFFCYNDKGHLSQVTYNAQGVHLAEAMNANLNNAVAQSQGEFMDYNFTKLPEQYTIAAGESVFAVPVATPLWSNDIVLSVSGNIKLEYPGKVIALQPGTGTLTMTQGQRVLKTVEFIVTDGHAHCSCVNAEVIPDGHVCNNQQVWIPMTPSSNAVKLTADGYYVLDWSGSKAASIQVADDVNAYLCLNGATIYATKTVQLGNRASLTICDCSLGQKGIITVSGGATGAPVWLNGTKTVTLMSGNIQGSDNGKSFPAVASTSSYSNFIMYGGTLTGGVAEKNYETTSADVNRVENYGGTVQMVRGAFTMYGGTVQGGKSTTFGGAVGAANAATVTMYGGTIQGGSSGSYGGTVGLAGTAVFNMYGGTIEGGESTTYGGTTGISNTSVFNMYGGTIRGGSSTTHGAAIGCGNGTFTIYDGTVYGGTATTYGGTASVMNSSKLNIYGGTIYNGTAKQYADGVYTTKNSITLGGAPTVEEIYLNGAIKLKISQDVAFTAAKSVGIAMANPDSFATVDADYATAFIANQDGYGVAYIGGALKLVTDVAQVGDQTYASLAEALAAGNTVRMLQNVTNETAVQLTQDLYLDLNGCDLCGLDLNGYKLYGFDSATNCYSDTNAGTLSGLTGTPERLYEGTRRYLTAEAAGSYSFHRFYVGITQLSLKPSTTSFGYKAQFLGDDTVQSLVKNCGYTLWLEGNQPVTQQKAGFTDKLTLRLQNIDMDNYGEAQISAQVFITLTDGTVLEGRSCSSSMKQMLMKLDQNLEALTAQQILLVQQMCAKYPVTENWGIESLLAWKEQ